MFVRRLKYILMHLAISALCAILTLFYTECRADENCILPEGILQISIYGTDGSRVISWSNGTVHSEASDYNHNESANEYSSAGGKGSAALPQHLTDKAFRLDVPYDISHDNKLLAATVYPDRIVLEPSNHVMIIDMTDDKVLKNYELKKHILSLSWSPATNYLAILTQENVTDKKIPNLFDLLGKFLGHPVSYNDLSVAIYEKNNNQLVCEKKLANKLRYGTGYIIGWSK